LEKIVEGYTRESGVRGLEAKIAQVIRNAASQFMEEVQ
jgi:ATP-dependent Lon protease